jgi:hypothetical protein
VTSPCGSVFRAVATGPGIPIPSFLQEVNHVPIDFQYTELDFQSAIRIIFIFCRRDSRLCASLGRNSREKLVHVYA